MSTADMVPFVPSGCPTPPVVTPSNLPAGYFPAEPAALVRVTDGDTLHVDLAAGEETVRMLWVNTEEKFGNEATAFGIMSADVITGWLQSATTIQVAPQKTANGQAIRRDPFDRMLALIFVDGELFETRMVREGQTAYYTEFGCPPSPLHESLLYGEAEARANQRGIWMPGHPTDYRQVLDRWIDGPVPCRPDPFLGEPYCR